MKELSSGNIYKGQGQEEGARQTHLATNARVCMRVVPIILLPSFIQSLLSLGNTTWRDETKAMVILIVVWVVVTVILTAIILAGRTVVIGVYGVVVLAIAVLAVVVLAVVVLVVVVLTVVVLVVVVLAVVVLTVIIQVLMVVVRAPIALVDVEQSIVIVGTNTQNTDDIH